MVVAVAIAVVLAVLFVVQVSRAPVVRPFAKIEFHQTAAEPDFDNSTITVTNPEQLHRFGSLVHKYDVDLASFDSASAIGCTGGTTTHATLFFTSGAEQSITIFSCGSTEKGFTTSATSLFSGWRSSAG